MESAIRLCYSPLLSAPLSLSYGAKGSADVRGSRFHVKFNHATLCLSHFSTRHPVARSFGHANCMLNRFSVPSENEGSNHKILRGVTGVSLVLACVLGLFNFSSKMNPKFNTAYAYETSSPPTPMPHKLPGPEDALESLSKMINAKIHTNQTPPQLDHPPSKYQVDDLKLYAVGLRKFGNDSEALRTLKNAYDDCKKHRESESELKLGMGESELNLGMALVELYIFQGKFEEARKLLDDQIDKKLLPDNIKQLKYQKKIEKLLEKYENEPQFEKLSIAQILLYKAIVHTMLENKEAAKWGKAFIKTLPGNE